MNIRWLKFSDVMNEAGLLIDLDEGLNQIENAQARKLTQAINVATDFAWKFHPWDGACWLMTDLQTSPDTDPVPLLERGWAMLEVYQENPLTKWAETTNRHSKRVIDFREQHGRVRLNPATMTTPYYLVRTAAPQFGITARNNATAYVPGDVVYDTSTGEVWRCHRAHTGQALPTAWDEWTQAAGVEASPRRRRAGLLYTASLSHDADEDVNAPAFGSDWTDYWTETPHYWAPQRLPHFLLSSVLAGVRAWLETRDTGALHTAMLPGLESEITDYTITRRQRYAAGGSTTIL